MPYTDVKSIVIFLKWALVQHTLICLLESVIWVL